MAQASRNVHATLYTERRGLGGGQGVSIYTEREGVGGFDVVQMCG